MAGVQCLEKTSHHRVSDTANSNNLHAFSPWYNLIFSSVRSTKAGSEWSCFGKIIKVNYVIYRSSLYLKTLHLLVHNIIQRPRDVKQYNHCSQLLQLIPQLVAKISSSSSHKNFSSLDHTNIRSQICLLTQIFVPA